MSAVRWAENGTSGSARWHSENSTPAPVGVVVVDDRTTAKAARRLATDGTGLLWRGDYHNANCCAPWIGCTSAPTPSRRQTTRRRSSTVIVRRAPSEPSCSGRCWSCWSRTTPWSYAGRPTSGRPATTPTARPTAVRTAATAAGATTGPAGRASRSTQLGGVLSAYQWHQRGVEIDALDALDARIHPTYGVLTGARRVHRPG